MQEQLPRGGVAEKIIACYAVGVMKNIKTLRLCGEKFLNRFLT
jgi:hypothetical protein